jgi:hypothetical protein
MLRDNKVRDIKFRDIGIGISGCMDLQGFRDTGIPV